jgi:hypothetical protein
MDESTRKDIIDVVSKFLIAFLDVAIVYFMYTYIAERFGFPILTYWDILAIMFALV